MTADDVGTENGPRRRSPDPAQNSAGPRSHTLLLIPSGLPRPVEYERCKYRTQRHFWHTIRLGRTGRNLNTTTNLVRCWYQPRRDRRILSIRQREVMSALTQSIDH